MLEGFVSDQGGIVVNPKFSAEFLFVKKRYVKLMTV